MSCGPEPMLVALALVMPCSWLAVVGKGSLELVRVRRSDNSLTHRPSSCPHQWGP